MCFDSANSTLHIPRNLPAQVTALFDCCKPACSAKKHPRGYKNNVYWEDGVPRERCIRLVNHLLYTELHLLRSSRRPQLIQLAELNDDLEERMASG